MARRNVIILVSVILVVAVVIIVAICLFIKHSSSQENPITTTTTTNNGSQVLTGELCPCHSICVDGYTCLSTEDCHSRHSISSSSSGNLNIINCSAAEGYVCCPPVTKIFKIPIRDPEMNKKLLPIHDCGQVGVPRIIGGKEASLGMFPWMALLTYRRKADGSSGPVQYLCGGTLISDRYILTAAHCVDIEGYGNPVHVRLGELDISKEEDCEADLYCADSPVDVEIEKMISHEGHNETSFKNDIALLRLKTSVTFTSYIIPICLPFGLNITGEEEETSYIVAGWGKFKDQHVKGSDVLLFATVESVPVSECNESKLPPKVKPVNELQLCATGGTGENDPCRGDSGGPMMENIADKTNGEVTTNQIGIISFGATKCGSELPSVFTRVNAYLRWILTNLEP